ncbi:hypothetical protein V6N13_069498 [Hibiscus sabdariffa]|uniref:Protein TIFY n=1 Tax=Hibiscus sabdariffa TaxID=183260 RepID=A0ABR2PGE9_9ROSI
MEAEDVRCKRNEHGTKGSRQTNYDMSHSIVLFRKYLRTKSKYIKVGKTNKEESDVMKRKGSPPLTPLTINFSRLLQSHMLPQTRSGKEIKTSSCSGRDENTSKAQLTIFYSGIVNVYDDVPTDKAQAIMVLAGESCLPKPVTEEAKTSLGRSDNITECSNSCKLQAVDLPLARKISVQHFLQKRRSRIVSNSPYAGAPVNCCRNNGNTERKRTEHRISMQNNPRQCTFCTLNY